MNKFEKEALNALSEEEQNKIAGGNVNTDEALTENQCNELKNAVFKVDKIDPERLKTITKCIAYGCPSPVPKIDWPAILKEKKDIDTNTNNNEL